jgi:hypothetical protein
MFVPKHSLGANVAFVLTTAGEDRAAEDGLGAETRVVSATPALGWVGDALLRLKQAKTNALAVQALALWVSRSGRRGVISSLAGCW